MCRRQIRSARAHGTACPYKEIEPLHAAAGTTQGALEQKVWLQDHQCDEWMQVRRISLPLAEAIRKFAIADLTNSPRGCAMSHGPLQT